MGKLRWILWQGLIAPSMERFIAGASNPGFEFSGLILQAHEEAPYVAHYRIKIDEHWNTRSVEIELEDGGRQRVALTADGSGHWLRDGQPLRELGDSAAVPDMLYY